MVTPDWTVINALLAVASSPLTLLIMQLTQIVQAQVLAKSSARAETLQHVESLDALGAIDQRHIEEMGVFRTIAARLTMILDEIRRGFAPTAPGDPPADSVAPSQVVEPDAAPQGVGAGTWVGAGIIPSRELQVVRRRTTDLSTYLASNPVSTSTIIDATDVERKAKEIWQDSALGDAYQRLTPQERAAVRQAIPDWSALQSALRAAIAVNAILVLPTVLGASQEDAYAFYQASQRTVDTYNERCEANSAVQLPEIGPSRLRQAQRLRLATNILSPQLAWTSETVAAIQRFLHMMPTICVQVDLRQPDGVSHLSAWYWATGDQRPTAFSQWLKPTTSPFRSQDEAFATAQMLIVLLADLLSLGASEGVSVVSDLLAKQGVSERLQERFYDWFRAVRAAFSPNYGDIGVSGVPKVPDVVDATPLPEEVVEGAPAILLASLRGCVAPFRFNSSITGYTDGLALYLAMQDDEAAIAHAYYLMIEQRDDQRVVIRALWERLGAGPLTMVDVDQRLDACAERCMSLYRQAPERFALVVDEPLEALIHHLATKLRALADNADNADAR